MVGSTTHNHTAGTLSPTIKLMLSRKPRLYEFMYFYTLLRHLLPKTIDIIWAIVFPACVLGDTHSSHRPALATPFTVGVICSLWTPFYKACPGQTLPLPSILPSSSCLSVFTSLPSSMLYELKAWPSLSGCNLSLLSWFSSHVIPD